jgi:hypothetical protein
MLWTRVQRKRERAATWRPALIRKLPWARRSESCASVACSCGRGTPAARPSTSPRTATPAAVHRFSRLRVEASRNPNSDRTRGLPEAFARAGRRSSAPSAARRPDPCSRSMASCRNRSASLSRSCINNHLATDCVTGRQRISRRAPRRAEAAREPDRPLRRRAPRDFVRPPVPLRSQRGHAIVALEACARRVRPRRRRRARRARRGRAAGPASGGGPRVVTLLPRSRRLAAQVTAGGRRAGTGTRTRRTCVPAAIQHRRPIPVPARPRRRPGPRAAADGQSPPPRRPQEPPRRDDEAHEGGAPRRPGDPACPTRRHRVTTTAGGRLPRGGSASARRPARGSRAAASPCRGRSRPPTPARAARGARP